MKTLVKTLLAASALFVATTASAGAIINVSYDPNAEATFLASLSGPTVVENFNGLGGAQTLGSNQQNSWENTNTSFSTDVGTFTLIANGQSGSGNVLNNQLMIESTRTGEFGREVLASNRSDLWLDSNDAKKVTWTFDAPLTGSFNAFGFYLADAADVGAILTLSFSNGAASTSVKIHPKLPNANLAYVSVVSDQNIIGGTFTFLNSTLNDGWGIDDVTIGNVPEPGTLLLMGLGLLGLGAARRRMAKQQ